MVALNTTAPGSVKHLVVTMTKTGNNSQSDPDLYVKRGGIPTTSDYDFKDDSVGSLHAISYVFSPSFLPLACRTSLIGHSMVQSWWKRVIFRSILFALDVDGRW